MTLSDSVELWKIANPNKEWFNFTVDTNGILNRDALWNYLYLEYCDMRIIEPHSQIFHDRVEMFFDIHRWNIDKMVATMELKYNPIEDFRWHQHRKMDRDQTVDTDVEHGLTETENQTTNEDWSDSGSSNGSEVHLVSAFNDVPSPTGDNPPHYEDTEEYRDVTSEHHENEGDRDVVVDDSRRLDEDTTKNEVTDEDVHEDIDKFGINDHTYQELIEQERKQAEFNIYKWIARHFGKECMIAVW